MKKIIASLILIMMVSLVDAQVKNNTQISAVPVVNPAKGVNSQWNADSDGDGFGNPTVYVLSENQPVGYVSNSTDLDDENYRITNFAPQTFYRDADGDTFGNPSAVLYCSVKPVGYVTNSADCNDADASLNPNTVWYRESDGASAPTVAQCTQPIGYVRNSNITIKTN